MLKTTSTKATLAGVEAELQALKAGLTDLKGYLGSKKFHSDTTVQVSDIFLRLSEAERRATDACTEAWAPFITCTCGHTERMHHSWQEYRTKKWYCEGDRSQGRGVKDCGCTHFDSVAF